jgi:hypothetical protein
MNALVIITLSVSAVSSATGMILFRYGGRGNTTIAGFFNVYILLGCIVYMIGAIAALYSLSKVSAAQAYPCRAIGCGMILIGLFLVINLPNWQLRRYVSLIPGDRVTTGRVRTDYTMVPGAHDTLMALLVELADFALASRHPMAGSSPRGPGLPSRAACGVVAFAM